MTKKLFFDTDCLSSFLWVNNTNILQELCGGIIASNNYKDIAPYIEKYNLKHIYIAAL